MTSTPLSTRSTRSAPHWRSLSKKSAQSSLSLVVAKPEAGAPLASAVLRLPMPTEADSKKRERSASAASAMHDEVLVKENDGQAKRARLTPPLPEAAEATQSTQDTQQDRGAGVTPIPSLDISSQAVAAPQPNAAPARTHPAAPSDPTALRPPLAHTSSSDSLATNRAQAASRTSWLSSLSRGRTKEPTPKSEEATQKATSADTPTELAGSSEPVAQGEAASSDSQPVATASNSSAPNPPAVVIEPPTPSRPKEASATSSSKAVPVPVGPASGRKSWFGVSGSKSPPTPTFSSPLAGSSPLTSSSVDEEVPRLSAPEPSRPPPSSAGVVSGDSSQNLSSLNPSTSRFSLSIPLLGRPKVPLEKALASAQAANIRDASVREEPLEGKTDESTSQSQLDGTAQATELIAEQAPRPSDDPPKAQETSASASTALATDTQNSWWSYVGWGPSVPPEQPPAGGVPLTSSASLADAAEAPSFPDQPSSSTPPPPADSVAEPTAPAEEPAPVPPDTMTQAQSSSWYSPWAWYYGSAPAEQTETPSDAADEVKAKTAAELVKEEALAREEPAPTATVLPAAATPMNPIEATISANKLGWASFFSSRALLVKTITNEDSVERDANGMEVMDLDDDEGVDKAKPGAASNTGSASAEAEAAGGKQVAVRSQQQQQAAQVPPRAPSPTVKPDGQKSAPAGPSRDVPSSKLDPARVTKRKSLSPTPSKRSGRSSPTGLRPSQPNLVLPSWADTFEVPPRSTLPPPPASTLKKTMKFMSGVLFAKDEGGDKGRKAGKAKGKEKAREEFVHFGKALPRAWSVFGEDVDGDVLKGCKNVVVIGIHGWFPGAVMRSVLGEPTGTSAKFVSMMCQALEEFQVKHGVKLDKITQIPLEGEGTINKRVDKLYNSLTSNQEWMKDLHAADAILVATHSQGSIVSTHLLDRLIQEKHIRTSRSTDLLGSASAAMVSAGGSVVMPLPPQRVCCLALCGIHLGPLRYLNTSSLLQPYIQYFESTAARELFEFQNTENEVSKSYVKALRNVMDHGTKMVYTASLNDQVVPLYSGLFTAASHPLILRALYIDGDAYHSSDFLSNLLVLLLRILNSGLSDSGLLVHLSEATAGSLNGVGHSTAYEELATFALAVDYLFLTNHGLEEHPELVVEPFNATTEQNDYEIPWSLRDLIADERVSHFFYEDFSNLRNAFPHWHPKTTILRDIKRKLQPIQRLNTLHSPSSGSVSKL